jgi:hypothetical protein
MSNGNLRVGRVLRAGTRGFAIGCAVMQPDIPAFGSFVRAEGLRPGSAIYGLIYDVSVEDDLFVRQLISAGVRAEEVLLDNRENRQVPIEVSVLAVGTSQGLGGDGENIHHCLPAQPPVTLDWLYQCTDEEVRAFTAHFDYFRLVLDAREVPVEPAGCRRRPARGRARDVPGRGGTRTGTAAGRRPGTTGGTAATVAKPVR